MNHRSCFTLSLLCVLWLIPASSTEKSNSQPSESDTESDTYTDSDSDTNTDSDTYFGGDTASELDTDRGFDTGNDTETETSSDTGTEDNGEIQAISILANHGFNYARIRILVEPPYKDALYQDIDYVIATARAAKAEGMQILLDFFYSDGWADPGKQWKPASWPSNDLNTVASQLVDHTTSVLNAMNAEGVLPDMVQIGNEVINGMVHPVGEITWNPDNFGNFVALSSRGYDAVKSVANIPVMIQYAGNMASAAWWFSAYLGAGGKADVLATSFYATWHGTISDAVAAYTEMSSHGKNMIVVETAAYWTASRTGEGTPDWPSTKQGQYDFLYELTSAMKNIPRLKGIFYWGPTWAQEDEWFEEYPEWYGDEYPYDAEDRGLFDTVPGSSTATLNPGADAFNDAGGLTIRGVDVSEALIAQQRGVVFVDND